jgi:hypothetical protein
MSRNRPLDFEDSCFCGGSKKHRKSGKDLLLVGKAEMSDNFVKNYSEVQGGDPVQRTFGQWLKWHFLRGTRPGGKIDHPGRKWTVKAFAETVGVADRTIRYWLRDEHLPPDTETIERVLFGNIETTKGADTYAGWRLELRHAHAKSRAKGGEGVLLRVRPELRPGHSPEGDTACIPRFPNYTRHQIVGGRTSNSVTSSLIVRNKRNNLRRTKNIITTEFKRSNAIFTVSGQQTLIVIDRDRALFGFRNLVCGLHKISDEDEKERILIWILKRWNQESKEELDKLRYENVQSLIWRFKALTAYFGDPEAKATWEWLKSRAAVVAIQEASRSRFDLSQNILFGAVPNKWAPLLEFRRLYGDNLSHVDKATYTVFLRSSVNSSSNVSEDHHLRYFGHAKISADGDEVRGAELPSPGRDYDQAFGIVHAAATHFLKLGSAEERLSEGEEANERLRILGCSLMRIEEFVNL